MPMGRPTKFCDEMCQQAWKLCLLGATDAQMADFFGEKWPRKSEQRDKWKLRASSWVQCLARRSFR
jgi:hypothetical protein